MNDKELKKERALNRQCTDSFSNQTAKFSEKRRSRFNNPNMLDQSESPTRSNSEDETSDINDKKRRISSGLSPNLKRRRPGNSPKNQILLEENRVNETTYSDKIRSLEKNKFEQLNSDEIPSIPEYIEYSRQEHLCSTEDTIGPLNSILYDERQLSETKSNSDSSKQNIKAISFQTQERYNSEKRKISDTIDKENPLSIPSIFTYPPPSFPTTVYPQTKTSEDLQYERAVDSFIKNTKLGLSIDRSISQARKYYDKDGTRIYHPDDPRSKCNQKKNDVSCSKDNYSNDLERVKKRESNSEKLPLYEKTKNQEIKLFEREKQGNCERSPSPVSHDAKKYAKKQECSMFDEIGQLSNEINLDEISER